MRAAAPSRLTRGEAAPDQADGSGREVAGPRAPWQGVGREDATFAHRLAPPGGAAPGWPLRLPDPLETSLSTYLRRFSGDVLGVVLTGPEQAGHVTLKSGRASAQLWLEPGESSGENRFYLSDTGGSVMIEAGDERVTRTFSTSAHNHAPGAAPLGWQAAPPALCPVDTAQHQSIAASILAAIDRWEFTAPPPLWVMSAEQASGCLAEAEGGSGFVVIRSVLHPLATMLRLVSPATDFPMRVAPGPRDCEGDLIEWIVPDLLRIYSLRDIFCLCAGEEGPTLPAVQYMPARLLNASLSLPMAAGSELLIRRALGEQIHTDRVWLNHCVVHHAPDEPSCLLPFPPALVALSPATGHLAAADAAGSVWVLGLAAGLSRLPRADGSPVSSMTFSQDGGQLAVATTPTASRAARVELWRLAGEPARQLPLQPLASAAPPPMPPAMVVDLAFTHDGHQLVAALSAGGAQLWELAAAGADHLPPAGEPPRSARPMLRPPGPWTSIRPRPRTAPRWLSTFPRRPAPRP